MESCSQAPSPFSRVQQSWGVLDGIPPQHANLEDFNVSQVRVVFCLPCFCAAFVVRRQEWSIEHRVEHSDAVRRQEWSIRVAVV